MLKITAPLLLLSFATSAYSSSPLDGSADTLNSPTLLREYLPRLNEQKLWTDFASPEEIKLYDGAAENWKPISPSKFDLNGFNSALLGSKLPAPGIHPRVFFSPEDVPSIAKRYKSSKAKIMAEIVLGNSIWKEGSEDNKWYKKLLEGQLDQLTFKPFHKGPNGNHYFEEHKTKIYITHTPHLARALAVAAAHALFTEDTELSKEVATVTYNYYKLREPIIDQHNERGTQAYIDRYKVGKEELEPWPNDLWRGMHLISGGDNLGMAYDFTATWMTEEQKKLMRRVIKKSVAGKRAYGQNGPLRWRDTNWVGWDLNIIVSAIAIEGEEGYDPQIIYVCNDTLSSYMTWGINKQGTILETNGKNGAGIDYALKTAVILARRKYPNYFGHPHLRKLATSQIHNVVPAGGRSINNGTYGNSLFGNADFLAAAYPNDANINWLIDNGIENNAQESHEQYRFRLSANSNEVKKKGLKPLQWWRTRPDVVCNYWIPSVTYGAKSSLKAPKEKWMRKHLSLDLDFIDPKFGQLNSRSSNDKDALYINMEARPNIYVGGHQHHDAGNFYISALGRDWSVEGNEEFRSSSYHSVILIDGKGQGTSQHLAPAKAKWLGSTNNASGALASADLSYAYKYIYGTPMHYSWGGDEWQQYKWQPETDPEIVKIFRGTQDVKARVWMHSYFNYNWGPTMKAEYNPVQYVFRTAGLVRGENPYFIIVNDLKKDDQERLYTWQMQIPGDLKILSYQAKNLQMGDIVLGSIHADASSKNRDKSWDQNRLQKGQELLLIRPIEIKRNQPSAGPLANEYAPYAIEQRMANNREQKAGERFRGRVELYDVLTVNAKSNEGRFKFIIYPFKHGETLPETVVNDTSTYSLKFAKQSDTLTFNQLENKRSEIIIKRDGETILKQ